MEGSGMKESEGDRLKYAVCESTLSTAARSPFPNGEGYETGKAVSSTQSLPRVGKVASGASRIGFWRDEKEKGDRLKCAIIREHPSAAKKRSQPRLAAPLAPSKERGSRGHSLLPMEGGAPKGRIRIKCSVVLCKSIYESSIIKQVIWTGWGLVTSSGVTPLQNR